ncbi:MAG: hypothetical protein H6975_07605 [Gammaproteobacteria bacterium]|nr:hypothetical protein [Gammaproteobacteria bacterium]
MKILHILSVVLVLSLGAMTAHAAGFNMKSFPDGIGMSDMMYRFLVPEGVTITNKKGEVMKAGSIVTVPGSNIKLLESAYAKEQAKNEKFMSGFVNSTQYFGMPEEKVRDHAIISVKVPEGVTVEGYGRTIKGEAELVLMVANTGAETMPDTHPADYWASTGWEMK